MAGKGKDRLLSLLKGDGDNVQEDVKTYVKKQKQSSDYLKKVLLRKWGENSTQSRPLKDWSYN